MNVRHLGEGHSQLEFEEIKVAASSDISFSAGIQSLFSPVSFI